MWSSSDCCNRVNMETQATLLTTWQKHFRVNKTKTLWDYFWTDLVHKSLTLHGYHTSALYTVCSVPNLDGGKGVKMGSDWGVLEAHSQSLAGKATAGLLRWLLTNERGAPAAVITSTPQHPVCHSGRLHTEVTKRPYLRGSRKRDVYNSVGWFVTP